MIEKILKILLNPKAANFQDEPVVGSYRDPYTGATHFFSLTSGEWTYNDFKFHVHFHEKTVDVSVNNKPIEKNQLTSNFKPELQKALAYFEQKLKNTS